MAAGHRGRPVVSHEFVGHRNFDDDQLGGRHRLDLAHKIGVHVHDLGARVGEHVTQLHPSRVPVHRHGHRAEDPAGRAYGEKSGLVAQDDGHAVPVPHALGVQSAGHPGGQRAQLRMRDRAPAVADERRAHRRLRLGLDHAGHPNGRRAPEQPLRQSTGAAGAGNYGAAAACFPRRRRESPRPWGASLQTEAAWATALSDAGEQSPARAFTGELLERSILNGTVTQ